MFGTTLEYCEVSRLHQLILVSQKPKTNMFGTTFEYCEVSRLHQLILVSQKQTCLVPLSSTVK